MKKYTCTKLLGLLFGLASLILSTHPLHAQQLVLPNIDFAQFEAEAMEAVKQLPRKGGFKKNETYNHLYVFATQIRDSIAWNNIKTQADFIRSIDFQTPVQFDGYENPTNIYADYIYDSEGQMRWIYADGKATKVDLKESGNSPQNFLVEVARNQYQMVFVIKEALQNSAFFGIKGSVVHMTFHAKWESYITSTIAESIEFDLLKTIVTDSFEQKFNLRVTQATKEAEEGFMRVDSLSKMPTFMGGDLNTFRHWFQKEFSGHHKNITKDTNILLEFTIGADGWVEDVKIVSATDMKLAELAVQVVLESPQWTPGEHNGEPTRVYYKLPIAIRIQKEPVPVTWNNIKTTFNSR